MAGEEEAKKIVKKATKKVAEVTETGADAAKGALDAVGGLVGGIGKKAKAAASKAKEVATDVAGDAVEATKGAAKKAKAAAETVVDKAGDVAEGAVTKAKGAAKKAKEAAAAAVDKVEDVAGDALNAAKGAAAKAADVVGDVAEDAIGAAKGVVDKVEDVAGDALNAAKGAAAKAADVVGDVAEGALDAAKGVADKVGDVAEDALDAVGDLGKKGVGAAAAAGAAVLGGAAAIAGGLGDGAKDAVGKAGEIAGDAAGLVGDTAKGALGAVTGAAGSVVGAVTGEKKDGGLLVPSLIGIAAIIGLAWFGYSKMGAKAPDTAPVAEASMEGPAWFAGIGDKLKAEFPWLSLNFKGGQLVVSGEAMDKNAKDAALAAVHLELEATDGKGSAVIDNITVKGSNETPLGAALAALGENPDAAACSKAFTDTMAGRTINFETGKAAISSDSSNLLGALTGIATACKAHKIEIGGHTDSRGDDAANQKLSQARADAVKAFWVDKGVPAEGLAAVGYGETKPIDTAENDAAFAKNRRTEFAVK